MPNCYVCYSGSGVRPACIPNKSTGFIWGTYFGFDSDDKRESFMSSVQFETRNSFERHKHDGRYWCVYRRGCGGPTEGYARKNGYTVEMLAGISASPLYP